MIAQKPCENVRLYFPELQEGEKDTISNLWVQDIRELSLTGAEKCKKEADFDIRGYVVNVNGKIIKSVRGWEARFFPAVIRQLEELKAGDKFAVTAKVTMRVDEEYYKTLSIKRTFYVN